MEKLKIALVGAGLRGMYTYASYITENYNNVEIVSIIEPRKGRRELFKEKFNIQEKYVFKHIKEFIKINKEIDGVIISSSDDSHFENAKILLENGYNVLLENPLANTLDRIIKLKKLNDLNKEKILVGCNVLKYDMFFNRLHDIVNNNELGELINIQYNSDIGYWNFAHGYTRGNWRNHSDTSPLILNNSCQDISIITSLVGAKCKKVSSFGNLKHMNSSNFKLEMDENCFRCSKENECPYSAKKIYIDANKFIKNSVHINPTKNNLENILNYSQYGRCIYKCDNNVVDNMVNILEFENNVTAILNINAFTKDYDKNIKLKFSHGEVEGSIIDQKITINKFGTKEKNIINLKEDYKENIEFLNLFINSINKINNEEINKEIDVELESHIVAFALEYARVSEQVTYISEFLEEAINMTSEFEMSLI